MESVDADRVEGLDAGQLPKGITPEQLRILAYGSAVGREFDFKLLVAALGGNEENLSEEVEKLTQLGVLRERPGGDRFSFVHDEARAKVYQSLTASRLRVLHRKIAEAMERLYPSPPVDVIPEMGRHYFLGKVPEKSYHLNRRAALLSREGSQPEVAAHHLERARIDLRALPGDHSLEEAGLAEELGALYFATGDLHAADRLYHEGLEWVGEKDIKLRARLLLARAEVARERLELETAVRLARQAHELFSRVGDLGGVAAIHRILGRVALKKGANREPLEEGMRDLDLLQKGNDLRVLGDLCND
ncbi:MAG: hypothetical protein L3K09_08645, partial [Thermoplasmata archaeon]|nr:hypothetical protein [Thermoplasmata archaeon]